MESDTKGFATGDRALGRVASFLRSMWGPQEFADTEDVQRRLGITVAEHRLLNILKSPRSPHNNIR